MLNLNYLNTTGKRGTISWPPRSPDLTPLDTFLWGHLKNIVNRKRSNNLEEIKVKIRTEIRNLYNNNAVMENLRKLYVLCIEYNGEHINIAFIN